ncbi:glycogen synthase GlgA [Thiocystis violascens]|uniref:Glycogen synthase n=1 Tax=Thiocystis violascens (strain ATCC 17096 / DSM 198 / 6111) TaxID=765911 RepID=I3YDT2_THIV6|nr:glycogen synthase GlgA [Thiocystis violascens]AFL75150.1 glycogen/starch synthase, ADP-glucose type [Thiocystis violascens DSM 198]
MAKKPTGSKQGPTARPRAADKTATIAASKIAPSEAAPKASGDASAKSPQAPADATAGGKQARSVDAPVSTEPKPETVLQAPAAKETPRPAAAKPASKPGSRTTARPVEQTAHPTKPDSGSPAISASASPKTTDAVIKTEPVTAPTTDASAPLVADDRRQATKLSPPPQPSAAPKPIAPTQDSLEQGTVASPLAAATLEPAEEPQPERPPESAQADEPPPEFVPEPPPAAPPAPSRPSLFIVHITPELAAVAKVGGLADVVFGLSRELAIRGNHVEIILPKYASMRYDQIFDLQEVYKDLWVPWYDGAIHCTVFFGFVHDRKCFFIEPHSPDNFFNRGSIYGFKDDVLRYAFFSRAAMEFLWKSGKHPDIIHCHDWQTALVPVFLYEFYQTLGMTHPRVCLTIHNFAHQGVTGVELLHATGLHRPERFFDPTRMADNRHPKALNLLKGGIVYANFVTTVSPRYAFETKDQGQGFGLEPTLHTHHIKYGGVVNGIDYDIWNPEVDRHIPVHYGIDSIDGKYDNKRALRHRLMLADNDKPIVAFIGRLDPQKGLDLVRHAIFYTLERGAQFVLLGSSPDDRINGDFWGLKRMLNDSPDCHLEIGFDEDLSHLIYAGADMMLVPSRFEPCGLTQLISLRYGTIPVVRAIGGLADTVFDKDFSDRPLHARNGYVFQDYDNPGLESALGRAIACYRNHPEHFRELMKNAMRSDYSWNVPGQDYLNIYDYIRDA